MLDCPVHLSSFQSLSLSVLPCDCLIEFYAGGMNVLVHVFMYTYYGLAAMGPQIQKYLWWKKYITKLQMVGLSLSF